MSPRWRATSLQTDNGKEFTNNKIINWMNVNNIKSQYCEKEDKKCLRVAERFKPLVIESSKYSLDYLKTMAAHISSRTNKHTSIVLGNLLRSCSFALQRNQGTMLARRCLGLF
jgi:hypothetical protein